jgi:hypothetical protein
LRPDGGVESIEPRQFEHDQLAGRFADRLIERAALIVFVSL